MLVGVVHILAAQQQQPGTLTGVPTIDSLIPFLNLGLIVVLLVMFLKNIGVVPKWTYDELKTQHADELKTLQDAHDREMAGKDAQLAALQADKSELKATNDQLTRVAQEQFLPALIEANRLTAQYVDEIGRRGGSGGTP